MYDIVQNIGHMSKKMDITENHLMVLSLFSRGYEQSYYIREVCRLLPISHGTAQSALLFLLKKKVLSSAKMGKIRAFSLARNETARQFLVFTEIYKRLLFLEREEFAGEVLTQVLPYVNGCAVLFGSYANGTADEDSDLDLFIAGNCDEPAIQQRGRIYGIDINITVYPQGIFAESFRKDHLLHEVLLNHIIFRDPEYFINTVVV